MKETPRFACKTYYIVQHSWHKDLLKVIYFFYQIVVQQQQQQQQNQQWKRSRK
jgi:hypothetical protein